MMRPMDRTLRLAFAALCFLLLQAIPARHASGENGAEPVCDCESGFGACQHFLRAPGGITADPCYCDKCRETPNQHDGNICPEGMNKLCFESARLDCYLKRHAKVWGIACSECVQNKKCCNYPKHDNCPDCATGETNPIGTDYGGRPAETTVLGRL